MRLFLVMLLVGACGKDPLREDMKMFCRAVDVVTMDNKVPKTGPGHVTLMELGPWIEQRAKTPEVLGMMTKLKNGNTSIPELAAEADALVKKANIDSCPTLSWMTKPMDQ